MEQDRELLELAGMACGITGFWVDAGINIGTSATPYIWNPLDDDGDTLRLADALGFTINFANGDVHFQGDGIVEDNCIRRAIVRAAAEIGRRMKEQA